MSEKLPEKTVKTDPLFKEDRENQKCPLWFESKEVEGKLKLQAHIPDQRSWEKIFGTNDLDLVQEIIAKSVIAMGREPEEERLNVLSQALADYHPKNSMEAKLCAQAHVLFSQGMKLMNQANAQTRIPQEAHCMKFAIQCMRLHNETIQALDKLRRGGEQRVVVQHVNVEGGQAAFMTGNIQVGGGGRDKSEVLTP